MLKSELIGAKGSNSTRLPDAALTSFEFRRGDYIVRQHTGGVDFERLEEPRCTGRIITYESYSFDQGEVFLGDDGECIVGLEWPSGEPGEEKFYLVVAAFEDDLADWRNWDPNF
jgi:hypothetical protein